MEHKTVTLIIGGGIAAYRSLELIRLLRKAGIVVLPVITRSAEEFVTPLSVAALAENEPSRELFDLTRETKMGHIQLSRASDLIVVAPATANLMAKMAHGLADDLASTLLLATDTDVLLAPAMNHRMWNHPATRRNREQLASDGIGFIGPDTGDMACGEHGPGRLAEPHAIFSAITAKLSNSKPISAPIPQSLFGKQVIITSGPTHEAIDPVRYIANRSSGAQGSAIAEALAEAGAHVRFITGPARFSSPKGVEIIAVESASEMLEAVRKALPADIAIFAAAVADWRPKMQSTQKLKKSKTEGLPQFELEETVDILREIGHLPKKERPRLVIGFAAETENLHANAQAKLSKKGADWILANDVRPETGIMGGAENAISLLSKDGHETWPRMLKTELAARLTQRISEYFRDPQ